MSSKDDTAYKDNKNRIAKILKHLCSVALWAYWIFSAFVFDLDNYLISISPYYLEKYIRYKFIFILLIVAILWRVFGTKKFAATVIFVIFYPFIVIVRFVLRLMGISPNSFLAVVGSIIWTVRSAKKWFLYSVLYFSLFSVMYQTS